MPKMKDLELSAVVDSLLFDSVSYNADFMEVNEEYLRRYYQEPYGDEEDGFSQVVASDVRDIVDSDMTSLVRVFLGSGDVMSFKPLTDDPDDVAEAKEKTSLINHMILRRPDSYRVIHAFLKDAERQKMGVVHYYVDTVMETRELLRKGLTVEQVTLLIEEIKAADDVERVDIVEKDELDEDGLFDFRLRVTIKKKDFFIENIPTENFLLSRNSPTIEAAALVGHESYPTRGELVADGMSEEEVAKFPTSSVRSGVSGSGEQTNGRGVSQAANMRQIRWRDEGGELIDATAYKQWAAEKVHQVLAFAKIDYDGDGIAERRRILKIGNTILENEPYDHVPYAVASCILEPHKAIGDGRASLVIQDQSINTELERAMLDNIYDVGNPRTILGEGVNHDDFYDDRRSGVVRMVPGADLNPRDSVFPLPVEFVGNQILLVKQARDQSKAARTGTLLDSQGLEADQMHQETATRFNGIEKANEAKIELVARNLAEVGFRKLYDGAEWTLRRFMDKPIRARLNNGTAVEATTSEWRFESTAVSMVGLGSAGGEESAQRYLSLLQIQRDLKQTGSLLVDDQKVYNTLDKMVQALGFPAVSEFFNNPDIPQEQLLAQYEQLTLAMQQAQQMIDELSQSNPLAEAEQIKARAKLIEAQSKEKVEMIKADLKTTLEQMKMLQEKGFHDSDKMFDYTELELKYGIDIRGEGQNG